MTPDRAFYSPHHNNARALRSQKVLGLRQPSDQGIGLWLAGHEFEPNTTKDPPCRGAMHVKSVESSNVLPWCSVVVRRGGCQLRCRVRQLTMVQNDEVRRQKALV
ncbi:hypothetical protein TNCV_223871 [Trichonephila clavipes]|nr:hypothetical protein TNCV_223871 [Trichonephila clavipes]